MPATAQSVRITDTSVYAIEPNPNNDGSPVGYTFVAETAPGKFAGTAGADKASLAFLELDADQVIKLGAGSDVFTFQTGKENGAINGIVDGGTDIDDVYLSHQLSDYSFSLRSDGSIKIQYIDAADGDGAAVTFKDFETFTFRNIDDETGINYETFTLTTAELTAAILAGTFEL